MSKRGLGEFALKRISGFPRAIMLFQGSAVADLIKGVRMLEFLKSLA
jgi:hypothetical protein